MNTHILSITGFEEAFNSMFLSKRTWTPQMGRTIRHVCTDCLNYDGTLNKFADDANLNSFNKWLDTLLKMGKKHITVLRFLDIAIMTEGIHRAGQDDIDSHARRFDNRIIRNSTRLSKFGQNEMSDWYKDKIITTDQALDTLGVSIPEKIELNGEIYIKTPNGYVKEEYENNLDVLRGLYMLSIPSDFVSKINLCEWAHVFKQRNNEGTANPEVKQWAESVMQGITEIVPKVTRDYVISIDN